MQSTFALRFILLVLSLAWMLTSLESAQPTQSEPQLVLKSGRVYTWTLPGLPPTLFKQVLEIDEPAAITVGLPAQYDAEKAYPLVVLIGGAQGGSGHDVQYVQKIMGDQDVIVAALPLFLRELAPVNSNESNKWRRMYISGAEGEHIWAAWKPLVDVLFDQVPNIDRAHCFLGGFSNGANATVAVLGNPETRDEVLKYFNHFILVEGGMEIGGADQLAGTHFLLVEGDEEVAQRSRRDRSLGQRAEALSQLKHVKVEYWTMPKTGHGFPAPEKRKVANWIRAQCQLSPLPESE